jgi:hypothetical protein
MTAERWQRIKSVFFDALASEAVAADPELVRELCENDEELTFEVLSLLSRRDVTFLGCA